VDAAHCPRGFDRVINSINNLLPLVLGLAWIILLSVPVLVRAARYDTSMRTKKLRSNSHSQLGSVKSLANKIIKQLNRLVPLSLRRVVSGLIGRRRQKILNQVAEAELPVTIDLLTVAISAGCTPYLAVESAARWAPARMTAQLNEVRRACSLGWGFSRALNDWAQEVPPVKGLVEALLASEQTGAPVLEALARLATEERATARRKAETQARTVPVRLLFPLIFLVLPAFGLLTVVPALLAGLTHT